MCKDSLNRGASSGNLILEIETLLPKGLDRNLTPSSPWMFCPTPEFATGSDWRGVLATTDATDPLPATSAPSGNRKSSSPIWR